MPDACRVVIQPLGVHSDLKTSSSELSETSPHRSFFECCPTQFIKNGTLIGFGQLHFGVPDPSRKNLWSASPLRCRTRRGKLNPMPCRWNHPGHKSQSPDMGQHTTLNRQTPDGTMQDTRVNHRRDQHTIIDGTIFTVALKSLIIIKYIHQHDRRHAIEAERVVKDLLRINGRYICR